jgi:hypothetical protein
MKPGGMKGVGGTKGSAAIVCSVGRASYCGGMMGIAATVSGTGLSAAGGCSRSRTVESTRSCGPSLPLVESNWPAMRLPGERWEKSVRGSSSAARIWRATVLAMPWLPGSATAT